ncbi:MAG: NADH:flavin oxidoreductase [Deltaproteobacteria bacterium]|nr:NADH:flavin oxidoreductase [Deltaproteobacteria bacterium]
MNNNTNPFSPVALGRLTLKNRFVRSATWDGMGFSDGSFSPAQVELYHKLSAGGSGLLTTGFIGVNPQGRRNLEQNLISNQKHQQSLSKIAKIARDHDSFLLAQLVHCGGQAKSEASRQAVVAPSAIEHPIFEEVPQELTENEIKETIANFGETAARAREAGCGGIQIHAAHGYLISQFLSPFANQRTDDYGGSPENRARFLIECYSKIREYVGHDFTITIKINGSDYFENGLECSDSLAATQELAKLGLDGVEVSGGSQISIPLTPIPSAIKAGENEVPFATEITAFAETLPIPIIAVGGIRSLETAERLLNEGVSLISLCRPLIHEPDLVNQWQNGRREPSTCNSCNRCFIPAFKGKGIKCLKKK